MTANGEAFHPNGLTAAHKFLPLPTFVKVTNLNNHRFRHFIKIFNISNLF